MQTYQAAKASVSEQFNSSNLYFKVPLLRKYEFQVNLKHGLSGKTAQPLVVKEPKPEQGNVLVHMSVLTVQEKKNHVRIYQNAPVCQQSIY